MSQADMLEVIESDKDKWWSSNDICNALNINKTSAIYSCLYKLRKSGFVLVKINEKRTTFFHAKKVIED